MSWFLAVAAALVTFACEIGEPRAETGPDASDWVLDASEAVAVIEEGNPTVLDSRTRAAWKSGHVPGAVRFDWEDFTPSARAKRGRLSRDDAALQEKLRSLGVSSDRRVVVVGPKDGGWGESGRAVWTLRTLGHDAAAWVEGGHESLVAEGIEETTDETGPETGDFEVERRDDWSIERDKLRSIYRDDDVALLDTREPREYRGKTPYGEARGGHIPGARHLYFEELLRSDGRLIADVRIREKLEAVGAEPNETVVVYCTGGVRSAWVASVLVDLGYRDVRNYAGSTWEWSAGPAEKFPLEKP